VLACHAEVWCFFLHEANLNVAACLLLLLLLLLLSLLLLQPQRINQADPVVLVRNLTITSANVSSQGYRLLEVSMQQGPACLTLHPAAWPCASALTAPAHRVITCRS